MATASWPASDRRRPAETVANVNESQANRKEAGFTLVEIMIAIAVAGILIAIALAVAAGRIEVARWQQRADQIALLIEWERRKRENGINEGRMSQADLGEALNAMLAEDADIEAAAFGGPARCNSAGKNNDGVAFALPAVAGRAGADLLATMLQVAVRERLPDRAAVDGFYYSGRPAIAPLTEVHIVAGIGTVFLCLGQDA